MFAVGPSPDCLPKKGGGAPRSALWTTARTTEASGRSLSYRLGLSCPNAPTVVEWPYWKLVRAICKRSGDMVTQSSKRIYLDVCALCRPFDDQSQIRIRLETDSVQLILSHVGSGDLVLIVSPVHEVEVGAIEDGTEREHLLALLQDSGDRVAFDLERIRRRAEHLAEHGLGLADAAHVAFAEAASADFVTCDDQMLRQCQRIQPSVWFGTPVAFCDKENLQ